MQGPRPADSWLVAPRIGDPFLFVLPDHLADVKENGGGLKIPAMMYPVYIGYSFSNAKAIPDPASCPFTAYELRISRCLANSGLKPPAFEGVAGAAMRSSSRFVAPISPIALGWKNARFLHEIEGEQGLTSI